MARSRKDASHKRVRQSRGGAPPSESAGPAAAAPARARGERWGTLAISLAVSVAVFLAFRPALDNDFVDWDDPDNILKNPDYRGLGPSHLRWMFTTFHMGHYQPLSWMTLGADYLWGRACYGNGLDPRPYHRTNVLLHAASAVLVYLLTLRLSRHAAPRGQAGPWWPRHLSAALAGLLFGLHPLRVESVAWVTERRDVLSSFFLLLTVSCYVRMADGIAAGRRFRLMVTLAVYSASLLSRAIGVTLPLVLLLLDWYPLRRLGRAAGNGRSGTARGAWLEKLPFVVLAIPAAILAVQAQASVGAAMRFEQHDLLSRLAQACYGLVFYVHKTLLPTGLSPIYELRLPLDILSPRYLIPTLIALVGGTALAILAARGRRRAVAAAAGCYALLLLPVLGFAQSGNQEVAARYSYLPSVPLVVLLAAGVRQVWRSTRTPWAAKLGLGVAAAAVPVTLALMTRDECRVWRNTDTLWERAARVAPHSSIAQNGYGWVLLQRRNYDQAVARFRTAISLQPANAKAHHNLWRAFREQEKMDELLEAYRDSIRLWPRFVDAHYNLGVEWQRRGQAAEAIAAYQAALTIQPDHSQAHTNLGMLLSQRNEVELAQQHYQAAIAADPRNATARRNLALLLKEERRDAEAIEQLRAAVQIDPNHAGARQLLEAWTAERGQRP